MNTGTIENKKLTLSRCLRNFGPASAIYLEWKAKPELLTSLAKIFSSCNFFTNLAIDSGGPEMVTLSPLLWHAATISSGLRLIVSSHDKPGQQNIFNKNETSFVQRKRPKNQKPTNGSHCSYG